MFRNQSVNANSFSMVPRPDVPRSTFKRQHAHKSTFDSGWLIPVYCEEVLPGDTVRCNMTAFARLATPITPVMDNMYLDSFFFFVPNRLVWGTWKRFMGEQTNPGDSISYVLPKVTSGAGGFTPGSIYDYFGLPTAGQVSAGQTVTVNSLPLRAYNLIYNEWFRDQNLCPSVTQNIFTSDGPDTVSDFNLKRRGKRHDYFTSALPWPQKGGTSVSIPLGSSAPIRSTGLAIQVAGGGGALATVTAGSGASGQPLTLSSATGNPAVTNLNFGANNTNVQGLFADLSQATAATINQLRTSFQIQKLLERDARGGTRYTEIVRAHFGVVSPDARLQRPEYLGGGTAPIVVNPVAQQSGTGASGTTAPLGTLGAVGTMLANRHGFSQSFTEHGYIIGIVSVRADLSYQQGIRRHWSRNTRYDFYFPAFAHLGEQAILNKEIYATGVTSQDDAVFGYQERWAEYRHSQSQITGLFRSTSAGTVDFWHLAQRFTALPVLNQTFIEETPPLARILAVGAAANGQQLIFDSFFDSSWTRPLPMFSVPGMLDHF